MTARSLYQVEPVLDAVSSTLAASVLVNAVPVRVDVRAVSQTATPPMLLLVESGGRVIDGPPMAGDQTVDVTVQILAIGQTLAQAGALRDEVVWQLAGRAADGRFVTALSIPGFVVVNRSAHDFTPTEVIASLAQAAVQVTLTLERES